MSQEPSQPIRELLASAGITDTGTHGQRLLATVPRVFDLSPFAQETCRRDPALLLDVLSDNTTPVTGAASITDSIPGINADTTENEAMRALRLFRHRHLVRIIIEDFFVQGATPVNGEQVETTLAALSRLAEVCIRVAEQFAHHALVARFGAPVDVQGKQQRLITLGMGKLGGGELNFSSDIDLIMVFPANGDTVGGQRSIDNAGFFRKVTQSMVKLLGQVTEDGFVYRVDLRLRPFGDSGPLVMNFDGVENYYLYQGREWERYAMIKARAITGDPADIAVLNGLLRPFVYRRYLDYSVFESLRDMKQRIHAEVMRKGMQDNIKLGRGGIREIEFIGQAFQLVRGGREPRLQQRSILRVLEALGELELMPHSEISQLRAAYFFLRHAENLVQMMRDHQVHVIPEDEGDFQRLLIAMGYQNRESFYKALNEHRQNVSERFGILFQMETDPANGTGVVAGETNDAATASDPCDSLWLSLDDQVGALALLENAGFTRAPQMLERLTELESSAFYRSLSATGHTRVERLMPLILRSVRQHDCSWSAFDGLLKLVRSVGGRSVYLQVLIDTPDALALLTRIFARSPWIAEFVSRYPIVIDELIDPRRISRPPEYASLQRDMKAMLERLRDEDLEMQMDGLRQYRQAATLRVAVAELEGHLSLMQASDCLSWIAELILEAVIALVATPLFERYGRPCYQLDGVTCYPALAIVAYGKLGGWELGFGSDLDLVFLHDSEGERQQTDGDKPVENQVFFARMAQKTVHFLSTMTSAGVLYETDTRLRPNGQSGMLVSSVRAFRQYQLDEAWTWEHQALVRARAVVSTDRILTHFNETRLQVLSLERDPEQLRESVSTMRRRMIEELGSSGGDRFHLKQDRGGIADIEFMVQYAVLLLAGSHPELTIDTDNVRLLERLEPLGVFIPGQSRWLHDAYLAYRTCVHECVLMGLTPIVDMAANDQTPTGSIEIEVLADHRQRVIQVWQQLFESAGSGA